jgi:hypothetical protein
MAYPKFVSGTNTLEFSRGLQFPLNKPLEMMQAVERVAGGALQVEELGNPIRRFRLKFKLLPEADYIGLQNWFQNIAQGAMQSFTFYDEDGSDWTIRILSDTLDFPEVRHQRYSGELLVEVAA